MDKPKCTDKTCENFGHYCRKHLTPVVKKAKPVEMFSDKRKEINKEYNKLRTAFLRAHPLCEVKELHDCKKISEDVHHKSGRATTEDLLNVNEFLAVCRNAHSLIEQNPVWAKKMGYSNSRLKTKKTA